MVDNTLWHPSLFVKNNIKSNHMQNYGTTIMIINNKGYVRWMAAIEIKTFCDLTLYNWPFDEHTCLITFAPATFMDPRVVLYVDEHIGPGDNRVVKSGQWRVNKASCKSNLNITHSEVTFKFNIHRNPELIQQTFLRPFTSFTIFILLMFLLPMNVKFRISYNAFLIGMMVLLLVYYNAMFAANVPTPYISKLKAWSRKYCYSFQF